MEWISLGGLGIIWVALLLPQERQRQRRRGPKEFDRDLQMLAMTELRPGRVVLAPRKDARFLGPLGRARARLRQRRRRILAGLLEAAVISAIIGAFPPFRAVWVATGILLGFFLAYLVLLLQLRGSRPTPALQPLASDNVVAIRPAARRSA